MNATCSADQCTSPATAKGLCAKHRMRQLRAGDTATVRAPGRPSDDLRVLSRALWSEMSPRTFARFWRASRILNDLGGESTLLAAVARSTRPNGSMNIAQFTREADGTLVRYLYPRT